MDISTRWRIKQRARDCCEFCRLPQRGHEERFSIDHVIPRKHGGNDGAENLALSCLRCNLYKGTNLSGIDPDTRQTVELFNPRRDLWPAHFRWEGSTIVGLTSIGRATIAVLRMNDPERVRLRDALIAEGILEAQ